MEFDLLIASTLWLFCTLWQSVYIRVFEFKRTEIVIADLLRDDGKDGIRAPTAEAMSQNMMHCLEAEQQGDELIAALPLCMLVALFDLLMAMKGEPVPAYHGSRLIQLPREAHRGAMVQD